ncbi:hypothetical protein QBC40DRAFT_277343 [Triangularia verruculosa]|uniref:Uncharacterized protein n=1 Tax=Triangularia verruculosa TaxID=2587418 RepID=A0AAN6XK13_9PEZI|nr:hypothetical protein QBC40DRAFT_277343 [Triangularia verruculosa]
MATATATADSIPARSPSLLTAAPASATTATCGAVFVSPNANALDLVLVYHHLDILTVSYRSTLANPTLSCWCGGGPGQAQAVQKLSTDNASPFNGSARLQLNFSSNAPCWFELTSESGNCGDVSDAFVVLPNQRPPTGSSPIASISAPSPTPRRTTTSIRRQKHLQLRSESTSTAPTVTIPEPQGPQEPQGGEGFSPGAKAGIGIGIGLICIAIIAMSILFFKRRRRGQENDHLGAIIDHERGKGRKSEKRNPSAPSVGSGRSDEEALCPIQPVFDGFPGSMGYDDVRSLHSISYSHSHSPSPINGPHSPVSSQNNNYWVPPQERSIERDELQAARLKSQSNTAIPPVVSYGPNPVTPTLPRPTPRVIELERKTSPHSSPDSIAAVPVAPIIPLMPDFPEYPDYTGYSIPPPSRPSSIPEQIPQPQHSPPRKSATPNVVTSYGPNRVTPTPVVVSPTVPPDENILSRRYQEHGYQEPDYQEHTYQVPAIAEVSEQNHDRNHHERQFSWEMESPLLGASPLGGLPPYASVTEWEAMEKGAIRNMAEPQAEAELPPTKDGYYHDHEAATEYELPGAAVENAPQLPFQAYRIQQDSNGGGRPGGRTEVVVNEQKVLMTDALFSDADMKLFMEQKAAAKAKRLKEMEEAKARGEEYDLGQPMGQYQARAAWGR